MLNKVILESPSPTSNYAMVDNLVTLTTTMDNGSYPLTEILSTTVSSESGSINCNLGVSDCAITVLLWTITAPIVLLLGTIGNTAIIIVMSRKSLRKTAFGHYLIAIAICDLIAIWIALIRHFIKNAFQIDIRREHVVICWFQKFLLYGSVDASVWLLCAVTLERTLSIYCPTRSVIFKSLKKTKLIILLIVIIQYGWNLHVFFTSGHEYSKDGNQTLEDVCGSPNAQAEYFNKKVLTYIAMVDYSIVPFISMLTMNIAIFVRLRQRDIQYNECAKLAVNGDKQKVRHSNVSHKTLMLLPVTICFLVTTLPNLAFTGVEMTQKNETKEVRARMEIADFVFSVLMYLNHSLNFFLYCLTGKMFRARCYALLTSCCRGTKDGDSSWETMFNRTFKKTIKVLGSPLPRNKRYNMRSMETSPTPTPHRSPTPTPHRSRSNTNNTATPPFKKKLDTDETDTRRNSLFPPSPDLK